MADKIFFISSHSDLRTNLNKDSNKTYYNLYESKVCMDDVTFVTNVTLGTEKDTKEADVNNDDTVNMPDAMFIVNKILNGKFPDE